MNDSLVEAWTFIVREIQEMTNAKNWREGGLHNLSIYSSGFTVTNVIGKEFWFCVCVCVCF